MSSPNITSCEGDPTNMMLSEEYQMTSATKLYEEGENQTADEII